MQTTQVQRVLQKTTENKVGLAEISIGRSPLLTECYLDLEKIRSALRSHQALIRNSTWRTSHNADFYSIRQSHSRPCSTNGAVKSQQEFRCVVMVFHCFGAAGGIW
jgi:hypothetical protein